MSEDCSGLETQIVLLQTENFMLMQMVQRLEAKQKQVGLACEIAINYSTKLMDQGQPLGKWSYLKGLRKMAQTILDIVN